jgi:hypothetical protein
VSGAATAVSAYSRLDADRAATFDTPPAYRLLAEAPAA